MPQATGLASRITGFQITGIVGRYLGGQFLIDELRRLNETCDALPGLRRMPRRWIA